MRKFLVLFCLLNFLVALQAENRPKSRVPVPDELADAFDKYSKAWIRRDWGTVFDCLTPTDQKKTLELHGTKDLYIQKQEEGFKDTVTSFERVATYRMGQLVFTFAIVIKGKHRNGEAFVDPTFCSFELVDGRWCLINPVVPNMGQNNLPKAPPNL